VREGPTYKPAIDLEAQPTTATIATVPGPISLTGKEPIVFLDLETTGLGPDADICQLAAVCGDKSFDLYTMPIKPISSGASAVTGLTVKDNKMYHNRKEVDSVPVSEALAGFISFISAIGEKPVIWGTTLSALTYLFSIDT